MRRWTVTLGLTATAAAAALLAPRLLPSGPPTCQLPQAPEMAPPPRVAPTHVAPPPRAVPVGVGAAAAVVPDDAVPEVEFVPPTEPPELPDDWWDDAIDCGMG